MAPGARCHKGHQPFEHQHQRKRGPEQVGERSFHSGDPPPVSHFVPLPRIALKKSDDGSSTITSDLPVKLAL
jgi:hypothetical protein